VRGLSGASFFGNRRWLVTTVGDVDALLLTDTGPVFKVFLIRLYSILATVADIGIWWLIDAHDAYNLFLIRGCCVSLCFPRSLFLAVSCVSMGQKRAFAPSNQLFGGVWKRLQAWICCSLVIVYHCFVISLANCRPSSIDDDLLLKKEAEQIVRMGEANTSSIDDDLLLKNFYAEVSEVERDNEVVRILSCFKLNAFEYLNLPFDSAPEDVKKQYRKLSLLVHPDKCKHPQAKEAFSALAKAQQLLLDPQEREYLVNQINAAREELRAKRKKQLKKDTASKLKSLVDEVIKLLFTFSRMTVNLRKNLHYITLGKYEQEYEKSAEYQQQLKLKVREILTDQEWRRRKMQMRISEEEGRLKKDEEETKEMWKRKREHEEQWEGTRENRVSSWRDFMKGGKKVKKGELRPPKLKTEDPNKSYVQRPVKRG
ncbi:hypothetical protein M8C21_008882, partial [Ambrosia artemisiifolia]